MSNIAAFTPSLSERLTNGDRVRSSKLTCQDCDGGGGGWHRVYNMMFPTEQGGARYACFDCLTTNLDYVGSLVEGLIGREDQKKQYTRRDQVDFWTHLLQHEDRIPAELRLEAFSHAAPVMMFPSFGTRRWDHKIPFDVWKPLSERWGVLGQALPFPVEALRQWEPPLRSMPRNLAAQVGRERDWFRSFLIPTYMTVHGVLPAVALHEVGVGTVEDLMTAPLLPREDLESRLQLLGTDITRNIAGVLKKHDPKLVELPLEWSLPLIIGKGSR